VGILDEMVELTPHPAKELLEHFNVPLWKTAKYMRVSYYHMSHILSGRVKVSRKMKPKMDKLVADLKRKKREAKR
jgi:hypothetical protein